VSPDACARTTDHRVSASPKAMLLVRRPIADWRNLITDGLAEPPGRPSAQCRCRGCPSVGGDSVPANRREQHSAPTLPHMPKIARCLSAYSCTAWHIPSKLDGRDDRPIDCAISLSAQAENRIRAVRTLAWRRVRLRAEYSGSGVPGCAAAIGQANGNRFMVRSCPKAQRSGPPALDVGDRAGDLIYILSS
jgi:hypothetical protein